MLPLTLITSVFGMNVLFPGETTSVAFWVILGALVATLASMIAFFRWKRWI
jgi:Mg2+ and Co2+ transporter CorA